MKSSETKRISVVLATKNSLKLLQGAIESLEEQTFKDFDVVVIDGVSEDGTLEYLRNTKLNIQVVSEPDKGISDAYSKALRLAKGDIVGILSSDERYYPDTLEMVMAWYSRHPGNIVCGGKCLFLNEQGQEVDEYLDDYLDLYRHLTCEHVCSISTSFFNRKLAGEEFYYSTASLTCPDYEFWARLALKFDSSRFKWFDKAIVRAFRTEVSSSFRVDSFRQMAGDKIKYLENFFTTYEDQLPYLISFYRCMAGIHMWAAEQLSFISHESPEIIYHCSRAMQYDPDYPRINSFMHAHALIKYPGEEIAFQRNEPAGHYSVVAPLNTDHVYLHNGATLDDHHPMRLVTGGSAWDYSLEMRVRHSGKLVGRLWLRIVLTVCKGAVGIGKYNDVDEIYEERIVRQSPTKIQMFLGLEGQEFRGMIRSGGEGRSAAIIHIVELVQEQDLNN